MFIAKHCKPEQYFAASDLPLPKGEIVTNIFEVERMFHVKHFSFNKYPYICYRFFS